MSSQHIPQDILSDKISEHLKGRPVRAAVFLTYKFDPGFFETEVLPVLFQCGWSHDPKVRLVQLEEQLRKVTDIAVYYDRSGLQVSSQSAKLDYRRFDVSRRTGVFHPKMILILVEEAAEDWVENCLVVATMSANLTEAGWWRNVESCHIVEVESGDKSTFRKDLLGLISKIKQENQPPDEHAALEKIRRFLVYEANDSQHRVREGRWLPSIYAGHESFSTFMAYFVSQEGLNLEIISPYFENTSFPKVLIELLDKFKPKEVRIYLPEAADGTLQCSQEYYKAVQGLPRVHWGKLPPDILSSGSQMKDAVKRFVHAKVYRFWNQDYEILFVGSINLTLAAHSSGRSGNFETAVMVEAERPRRLAWWMSAIEEVPRGREFLTKPTNEEEAAGRSHELSLRYDWLKGELSYHLSERPANAARDIQILANGAQLFAIENVVSAKWVILSDEAAASIKELLVSTSIVQVLFDSVSAGNVLVREEGMQQKPSLLSDLTPEQILRYWSLLTPEQKELFLATHLVSLQSTQQGEYSVHIPDERLETMFDRFAGIFGAFNTFESHILDSLCSRRENEAACLLFGQKHDSLPSLVKKILDSGGDPVNRYVHSALRHPAPRPSRENTG